MVYYAAHSHVPRSLVRHDAPSEENALEETVALSFVEASHQSFEARLCCVQQSAGAYHAQFKQPTVIYVMSLSQLTEGSQLRFIDEIPDSRSLFFASKLVG